MGVERTFNLETKSMLLCFENNNHLTRAIITSVSIFEVKTTVGRFMCFCKIGSVRAIYLTTNFSWIFVILLKYSIFKINFFILIMKKKPYFQIKKEKKRK